MTEQGETGNTGGMEKPHEKSKDEICLQMPQSKRLAVMEHVEIDGRCHVWQGTLCHRINNSYGRFKFAKKSFMAHRASLIWAQGLPASSLLIARHTCANKLCINPKHLRWGSHAENAQDYIKHQKNGNRPLSKREALMHRVARGVQGFLR